MTRLFDAYIMVDWSAASTPKTGKDSIWIADLSADNGRTMYCNPATRTDAIEILKRRLSELTNNGKRVLLGFDFSLGYPAGTAKTFQLEGVAWEAMHTHLCNKIEDGNDNSNNRFTVAAELNSTTAGRTGPFWGTTSPRHVSDDLSTKKPLHFSLPEYRIVELYLREQGLGAPKSVWQLAYIGSVGSQSLMGIPRIGQLRNHFSSVKLWPFETGFRALTLGDVNDTKIIIAEIYPSLVKSSVRMGEPLDKAQVRTIARHYWEMDKAGQLGAAFAPPPSLNAEELSNINKEEGWILGISPINIGNLAS